MALEAVIKRDRAFVLGGLVGITLLAWAYIGYLAWGMPTMEGAMAMAMPQMQAWGIADFTLTFGMWATAKPATRSSPASPLRARRGAVDSSWHGIVGPVHGPGCG
jgi:predicted metal-binding membrane protein